VTTRGAAKDEYEFDEDENGLKGNEDELKGDGGELKGKRGEDRDQPRPRDLTRFVTTAMESVRSK